MRQLLLGLILFAQVCNAQPAPPTKLPTLAQFQQFVRAADSLRTTAEARIFDLELQVLNYDLASRTQAELTAHDAKTLDSLKREIAQAVAQKDAAQATIDRLTALLPRRYRKWLDGSANALVVAFQQYVDDLQRRSGTLFLVGTGIGFVAALFIFR